MKVIRYNCFLCFHQILYLFLICSFVFTYFSFHLLISILLNPPPPPPYPLLLHHKQMNPTHIRLIFADLPNYHHLRLLKYFFISYSSSSCIIKILLLLLHCFLQLHLHTIRTSFFLIRPCFFFLLKLYLFCLYLYICIYIFFFSFLFFQNVKKKINK